ncbi:hypothetical protein F750_2024 [Streptomyces sp. PAMC 26508]|nr:hypothetical protein F750_2024 [Streptomyces sp. PAMC 26508]
MREAESGQPGHGWVSLLWRTRQVGGCQMLTAVHGACSRR